MILALLHMGFGGLVFVILVWAMARSMTQGVPLLWLPLLGTPLLLGVGTGVGLLSGRPWAWRLAGATHATVAALCLFWLVFLTRVQGNGGRPAMDRGLATLYPANVDGFRRWLTDGGASGVVLVLVAGVLLAAVICYAFLLSRPARAGFDLGKRWWLAALAQLLVAATVLLPLIYISEASANRNRLAELRAIGSGAGNSDAQVKFLCQALEDGDAEQRAVAAWALGETGRSDVLSRLEAAARDDPDATVRLNCVAALAAVGGSGSEQALLEFLESDDAEIRTVAFGALREAGYGLSVARIAGAVESPDPEARALAADALGDAESGPLDDRLPLLEALARDDAEDVRSRAAFALGRARDPSGLPALYRLFEDERWEVRANAVQAVGMIGEPSARGRLESMLEDPQARVVWAAERALQRLD